jgi:MYXO-CTERM domain-containing protein
LGSLLATDTAKGAGWYFMNWYGAMTGNMVTVSVANEANTSMDGAVSVDAEQKAISGIFGGTNGGAVNVIFKNVPAFVGATASVKVEKVDWTSKDTVCNGTTTVSTSNVAVSDGQITVPMTGCNASSGYRISLAPNASGAGGAQNAGGTSGTAGSRAAGGSGTTTGGTSAGGTSAAGAKATGGSSVSASGAAAVGGTRANSSSATTLSAGGSVTTSVTKATGGFVATNTGGTTASRPASSEAGGAIAVGASSTTGSPQVGGVNGIGGAATALRTTGGAPNAQTPSNDNANEASGCGCRVAGQPRAPGYLALLGLLGVVAFRSKRRNR